MTLDQQWELLKPKIIALLEEGWSKRVALHKLGVYETSKMYKLCYKIDSDFKQSIAKYNKRPGGYGLGGL